VDRLAVRPGPNDGRIARPSFLHGFVDGRTRRFHATVGTALSVGLADPIRPPVGRISARYLARVVDRRERRSHSGGPFGGGEPGETGLRTRFLGWSLRTTPQISHKYTGKENGVPPTGSAGHRIFHHRLERCGLRIDLLLSYFG
jgi:hypothetical protein